MTGLEAKPELLAPAGDWEQLKTAVEAGADAVYFGLKTLNARRRARNFYARELSGIVETLHRSGLKAVLTLNTDLSHRETGEAARILREAQNTGVDCTLITDPALLLLRPYFPDMQFHWSTQAAITSSAGMNAARRVGIDRVVLPREMTLEEITKASNVEGVETEVFVQGALCFSVSGRCLLSSWGGGRSGNRGLCTSPCRVPWTADDTEWERYLSMRDVCLIHRLSELSAAGVSSFKIEGRLKTPAWTRLAVTAYRQVLDGASPASVQHLVDQLGDYTGRVFTNGYLDGRPQDVLGAAARPSTNTEPREQAQPPSYSTTGEHKDSSSSEHAAGYTLRITTSEDKLQCVCSTAEDEDEWNLPASGIRNPSRSVSLQQLGESLKQKRIQNMPLATFHTDQPEKLIPRRTAKAIRERISSFLHSTTAARKDSGIKSDKLPPALKERLRPDAPHEANRIPLGQPPNRVRIRQNDLSAFEHDTRIESFVIVDAQTERIPELKQQFAGRHFIISLPPVWFEHDLPHVQQLAITAAQYGLPLEVNSWDGWNVAGEAKAQIETGPGLPILNPLAAQTFKENNASCVTVSSEADRAVMEACTAHSPLPCCVYIFARPPLAISRADLHCRLPQNSRSLHDARGINVNLETWSDIHVLRSRTPYDLSDLSNSRINARWLAADFVGSPAPFDEWKRLAAKYSSPGQRFNYTRKLQ